MTPGELAAIAVRLDAIHETVREVKELAISTNGRVRRLEVWRAELHGAKRAVGWVPPFATALVSSAFSVLLYSIFISH